LHIRARIIITNIITYVLMLVLAFPIILSIFPKVRATRAFDLSKPPLSVPISWSSALIWLEIPDVIYLMAETLRSRAVILFSLSSAWCFSTKPFSSSS